MKYEKYWWLMLSVIHVIEPYYHLRKNMKGVKFLNEGWAWGFDEYSRADVRYRDSDCYFKAMQLWLAMLAPLCLLCFIGQARGKRWSIVLSALISMAMVATTAHYYLQEYFDGLRNTQKYAPEKFISHFILANIAWLIGSLYLVVVHTLEIASWANRLDEEEKMGKRTKVQ